MIMSSSSFSPSSSSVVVVLWILVLVSLLSLDACDGRRLAVLTPHRDHHHHHHHGGGQNLEQKRYKLIEVTNLQKLGDEGKEVSSSPSSVAAVGSTDDHHHHHHHHELINIKDQYSWSMKSSSSSSSRRVSRTTWRVPMNKRSEKHPDFNLDYSPPKTHPPSHN